MISYSVRAFRGLAFLFRHFNDVDVFVEDTTARNMYEILLDRMLEGSAKVRKVFQVGDRAAVIRLATEDSNDGRPTLYIIDGDLDLLLGIPAPKVRGLYRLAVYCSENLVLTERSVTEVAVECLPNQRRDLIRERLAFRVRLHQAAKALVPLFVCYAAAHRLDPTVQTIGRSVFSLCVKMGRSHFLSRRKIRERIDELRSIVLTRHRRLELDSTEDFVKRRLPRSADDHWTLISGKAYLLPLVFDLLVCKAGYRGTMEQLKVRLARHAEINIDGGLLAAVRAAAGKA